MTKYRCLVCGYIYDPAIGDPLAGIAPGTAFEDLPADWVCPPCGVGKEMFEAVVDAPSPVVEKVVDPAQPTDYEKKHSPQIFDQGDGVVVEVGTEISHPMEEGHHIVYIELLVDGQVVAHQDLTWSDAPRAVFTKPVGTGVLGARALCNLHGLWSNL